MQISKKGLIAIVGCLALGTACGKKKEDETAADATSTTANPVSNMSALPDTSTIAASSKTSLTEDSADAVTGTPPFVKDISPDNIEKYIVGSVSDQLAAIQAASTARDWDKVKTLVDALHDAGGKCHIIEDTARAISILNDNTSDLCYMQKIGAKGAGVLDTPTGASFEDGAFFKPATDGSDTIRKTTFGPGKNFRVFRISGATSFPNGYKVAYSSCNSSNVPFDYTVVTVDNVAGTFTLTKLGNRPAPPEGSGITSDSFDFSLQGGLKYDSTTEAYVFDTSKERGFNAKNARTDAKGSRTVNSNMTISADTLVNQLFMNDSFTAKDPAGASVTVTKLFKGINIAQFSGTGMSDVLVSQAAGAAFESNTSSGVGTGTAFENETSLGFEFNNTKDPNYTTITTGTYVDAAKKLYDSIATLAPFNTGSTPAAPGSLPADATTLCTATATTTVDIKNDSTGLKAIYKACDAKRPEGFGKTPCDGLRAVDAKIQDILKKRRGATGKSGRGN